MTSSSSRHWLIASVFAALTAAPCTALAATDPAGAQIESFYTALNSATRNGGVPAAKLRALVEQAFNLPIMAQLAVGASWSSMSSAEQSAVGASLGRYVAARYAREFDGKQTTVVDPTVQARGDDRLVKSELRQKGETPTRLYYRLRQYGGVWRAIDVYADGISVVATERADFASSLTSGGPTLLVKKLDEATAKLK